MSNDKKWRGLVAARAGGTGFDKPGTGYSFSAILAEERELAKGNVCGDPSSALLTLSVADPTGKMPSGAFFAGSGYYVDSPDATRYTDNSGIRNDDGEDTNLQIADYLNRKFDGSEVTLDMVQYSAQSIKGAITHVIPKAFFDEDTLVIFPTPGYGAMVSPINMEGATRLDVPLINSKPGVKQLDLWDFDLEKIALLVAKERKGAAAKKKVFMYVNVPYNPTGFGYMKSEHETLITWAKENNVFLIVDEAYINLMYDTQCESIMNCSDWTDVAVVLQSVSKGWNATGLRFGWMVGNEIAIKALRKVKDNNDSGSFGPGIAAGLACLEDRESVEEVEFHYFNLHKKLKNGLKRVGFGCEMPNAGLCQFTRAPTRVNWDDGMEVIFKNSVECAQWFREEVRISLMNYDLGDQMFLRWAVTLRAIPECGIHTEEAVIDEVVNRLQKYEFSFD